MLVSYLSDKTSSQGKEADHRMDCVYWSAGRTLEIAEAKVSTSR